MEKAIRINTDIKNKLSQEHAACFELKIKLKEAASEFESSQRSASILRSRLESDLRAANAEQSRLVQSMEQAAESHQVEKSEVRQGTLC